MRSMRPSRSHAHSSPALTVTGSTAALAIVDCSDDAAGDLRCVLANQICASAAVARISTTATTMRLDSVVNVETIASKRDTLRVPASPLGSSTCADDGFVAAAAFVATLSSTTTSAATISATQR